MADCPNAFTSIEIDPIWKLSPVRKHVMFTWLVAVPTHQRVPGEFYAVRIDVKIRPKAKVVNELTTKLVLAMTQLTGYLKHPPPLRNPFEEVE